MQGIQVTLPIGSIVQDRYVIADLLGKGGFGAVYLVKDRRVKGNLFALKEITEADRKARDRFTFEGNVLKNLDHPALPRVYRTFEDNDNARAYILMDYIEGTNLDKRRHQQPGNHFSLAQAMAIMEPIFAAVSYLHRQQPPIIHRDIKPANIIVPSEEDMGAVLVDFGIAKEFDLESTTTATRHCSPGYGAPEQYMSGTNPGTDIYGLGATIYTLLTGHVPADAFYRMTQLGGKNQDPLEPVTTLIPDIPEYVAKAITRAMAISSGDRFVSVEEFWQALQHPSEQAPVDASEKPLIQVAPVPAAAEAQPMQAPTISTPPRDENRDSSIAPKNQSERSSRRRKTLMPLFLLLAIIALLAGSIYGGIFFSHILHIESASHAAKPSKVAHAATPILPTTLAHPTQASSSGSTSYPTLASAYQGTISDKFTTPATQSTMSLTTVKSNNATISGHLSFGPGLQGDGDFTGAVSVDKKIQFTVPGLYGHLPLLFQGQIQNDGTISGNYCSYRNNNQCDDTAGGYGDWNIKPSS